MISNRRAELAYWLLVAVLFVAQAAYTGAGLERLWYEELAEGIRNPFWLEHRLVYDGVSSNVGWYGLVLIVYKLFGFSPYAPKYIRLALHIPFLVCAALLLKRWTGLGRAWLPLVAIGLSPTLLYFNNLGTSYGTDIELFPVVLFLIAKGGDWAHAARTRLAILQCATGGLAMVACLTYPSFLFYLPLLLIAHLRMNRSAITTTQMLVGMGWMAGGFLAPFGAAMAYVRNDKVLLFDPTADGAGVFRGGGQALTGDPREILASVSHLLQDLFFRGSTYYFAIPRAEFSGLLGLAAAVGIFLGSVVLTWKWKPAREPLVFAGLLCVLSIGLVGFTSNLPGLRRSTGFVSGVYLAVACAWAVPVLHGRLNRFVAAATKLACLLLVVHHLAAYGPNYRYLTEQTRRMNEGWFYRFGSPDRSVRTWAQDWVLQGKPLPCQVPSTCRYSEIYPAVAGYLKWNRLGDRPVLATDPGSGHVIELTPWQWEMHTLGH